MTRSSSIARSALVTSLRRRRLRAARVPRSLALSMPLGLSRGRPLRRLRRAVSSLCAAIVCFSSAPSPSSCAPSAFSSARDRSSKSGGEPIPTMNQKANPFGNNKKHPAPRLLPPLLPHPLTPCNPSPHHPAGSSARPYLEPPVSETALMQARPFHEIL